MGVESHLKTSWKTYLNHLIVEIPGKIDLKEMLNTDLLKLKTYLEEFKERQTNRREMKKQSVWVWHDEDELLRFQDDYFDGYHSR